MSSPALSITNHGDINQIEIIRDKFSGIVLQAYLREQRLIEQQAPYSNVTETWKANGADDVTVSVNDSTGADQDEASIAVNPLNPNNLVAGSHDTSLRFVDAAYYYSFDGGATWTHNHRLPGTDAKPNAGDAVVAFDSNGNAYYAYIWGNFAASDISIAISKSADGGKSWGSPKVVYQDPDGPGVTSKAWDKEWIEVDNWNGSPSKNTIYLTATFFDPENGHIMFTNSTDGGQTWSSPFEISDPSPGATDQLSAIAPAPDGSVYVAWLDLGADGFGGTDTVKVRHGANGGASWGSILTIQTIKGLRNIGESRAASNPTIVVAPKPPGTNPLDYNVYIAYAAIGSNNAPEVRLAVSTDKGSTWTVKKVCGLFLCSDIPNHWQAFFPALASRDDGTIYLIGGVWSSAQKIYGTLGGFSTDSGTTWWNTWNTLNGHISDTGYSLPSLSGVPSYVIGDYFDIDIGVDRKVHPIWTSIFAGSETDIVTETD